MGLAGSIFAPPPQLQQQLNDLALAIHSIAEDVQTLRERATASPEKPDNVPLNLQIVKDATAGTTATLPQNADQLNIVGISSGANTAGRYTLQIGTDNSFGWWQAANTTVSPLPPNGVLTVPRGVQVTLNTPANALCDVTLVVFAGQAVGRVS